MLEGFLQGEMASEVPLGETSSPLGLLAASFYG